MKENKTKKSYQKDRSTNMEEITEVGLEPWKDGFFDKYSLLPSGYKIAAAFFITVGVLAVIAAFVFFPILERTSDLIEKIKGISLLFGGAFFILTTVLAHCFHICSIRGASGLDEERKEWADKQLKRQKLFSSYAKVQAQKLNGVERKKKRPKTQKKSHQDAKSPFVKMTPEPKKEVQEKTIDSNTSLDTSKPKKEKHKKKKHGKDKAVSLGEGAINSNPPLAPPSSPIFIPNEAKTTKPVNGVKKPVFLPKTSQTMQARAIVLAGLLNK